MKTYYQILGVEAAAAPEEVKRAFRHEIARYHPDKVQHLGLEFQEIAATRAAELTEAYRVLMDVEARARYDQGLSAAAHPGAEPGRKPPPAAPPAVAHSAAPAQDGPLPDRRFESERSTTGEFVRRAVFAKLRDAVGRVSEGALAGAAPGIDAVYSLKGKGGLFRKAEVPVRLLAKYVAHVDAAAVEQAWPSALKGAQAGELVCLLLLGSGVAPARELSAAVANLRRRGRIAGPVVVPVDVRDWEALFPPEAPASVRAIIQRLRSGEA